MNKSPFERQLIAFLPNLRRFAISLCGSRDLADDLVQAACERALRGQEGFVAGTRFDAWMLRILRNLWIDHLRRDRTAGRHEDIDSHTDLADIPGPQTVEARATLTAVSVAISRLPGEQREVLLLVCLEDFTYRETAELLGIPIGTVMSRLSRARRFLADAAGIDSLPPRSGGA